MSVPGQARQGRPAGRSIAAAAAAIFIVSGGRVTAMTRADRGRRAAPHDLIVGRGHSAWCRARASAIAARERARRAAVA